MLLTKLKGFINTYKITADELTLLELIFYKNYEELESYRNILQKQFPLSIQHLFRHGFVDFYDKNLQEYENIENIYVRVKGEKVVEAVNTIKIDKAPKINIEQQFEEFWNTYPSTDRWGNFGATRALKANLAGCRHKFREIMLEGETTLEQLIKALNFQIELFKNTSKLADNKMSYFQNSHAWLHQRTFLQYLEIMKENDNIENDSMEVKL